MFEALFNREKYIIEIETEKKITLYFKGWDGNHEIITAYRKEAKKYRSTQGQLENDLKELRAKYKGRLSSVRVSVE